MSWRDKPTLINKIQKDTYYVFGDESGDIKGLKSSIKKYISGDIVKPRDSTFVLTTLFISPACLRSLYARFEQIKKTYLGSSIAFHAVDIERRNGIYSSFKDVDYQNFIMEIDDEVRKCHYVVQSTAINKWDYIVKHDIRDLEIAKKVICKLYKKHFKRVENMLTDFDKNATMVLEESSSPKMDSIILCCFVDLKNKGRLKHLNALYFTRKNAVLYPAGTELADFVSQSMFHIFSHPKCLISLRKTYKIKNSIHRDILVFDDLLRQ